MWGDLLASLQEPQPYQSSKIGPLAPPSLTLSILGFNHHPTEFVSTFNLDYMHDQILQKMWEQEDKAVMALIEGHTA